jgi:toxin CcdB
MAQFDLYQGVGPTPYVVDLQADALDRLTTRVVAPLAPRKKAEIMRGLTPVVEIDGREFVVRTQNLAAVHVRELRRRVGSLVEYQDDIKRALDLLFLGF